MQQPPEVVPSKKSLVLPSKKSLVIDPTPRSADADDDDRMFKRILAKYMQHQMEKDGLQLM